MELEGKIALVTGGGSGVGAGITQALYSAGADVAVSFISQQQQAASMVAAVQAAGRRGLCVALDQRDPASIDAAVARVVDQLGGVDILVNNAGWNIGIAFADLEALDVQTWDRLIETNLRGPYLLARALAPHLRARGPGRIVNIASLAGLYPGGSSMAYATAKAGLIHLTRCLAVALAPDVAVNCIAPGFVEGTRMAQQVPEATVDAVRRQVVLGRTASIDDIAAQAVALCRADSITGQTIVIDGGLPGGMH